MAVTTVGNRPQPPAQFEATNAAAQKSGAGEAAATATATAAQGNNAVQAQLAKDAFEPAAAGTNQAAALGGPEDAGTDQLVQALNSFVQVLQGVVDLVKNLVGGDQAQAPDQAQTTDPAQTAPGGTDPLDNTGGGPGLTHAGKGDQGTQPGAFGVAGIDQKDPNLDGENADYVGGQTNCGPTAMAEIARGRSQQDPNYSLTWNENGQNVTKKVADMSNEELVSTLGKIGLTDAEGTSPNGIIDMASAMGLDVDKSEVQYDETFKPGNGQPSHSFNQDWLDNQIGQGKKVVVNGAYEAKKQDGGTELVGHYMTIAGKNNDGTYAVMDPWDGKQKNLNAEQLSRFMQANQTNGGVMLAVG